jgi:TPR repeat protein
MSVNSVKQKIGGAVMNDTTNTELTHAYTAMDSQNYALARKLLEIDAAAGGEEGALHLGWLCEQGLGGVTDTDRAVQLYKVARNSDRCLGSYYLGSLLMRKDQVEEARQLLEESANLGHASAAYWAYVLNEKANNLQNARQFLAKATQLGHIFAQRDMARYEMTEASSVIQWFTALCVYWKAKAYGAVLIVRDIHDPRIR